MTLTIRLARHTDIAALTDLIQSSVRELQKDDYSPEQLLPNGLRLPIVKMARAIVNF